MVCRPAAQFCCGCSLDFGVKFILIVNFVHNCIFIACSAVTVIFRYSGFSFSDKPVLVTTCAGFAIAGLPIIVVAFFSLLHRAVVPVRLYLYYMMITFGFDVCLFTKDLILEGACAHIPALFREHGTAFACGASRTINIAAVGSILIIWGYCIFVVYSKTLDMETSGPDLSDLAYNGIGREPKVGQAVIVDHYPNLESLEWHQGGSIYGALAGSNFSSSNRIFGKYHEMGYPPPDHRL